jgi:CheY-like chemotaxis protein
MQEGAVVLTPRGDILYSNARFAALVGEPLESVLGSRIDRFLGVSDGNEFRDFLRAGNGRRRGRLIAANSSSVEVSLSLTTTASAHGDRLNLVGGTVVVLGAGPVGVGREQLAEASDGVSGLELLNRERPDVGIIDIGLPRMDGYQVARRIRDLPHGRNMLLLALTGYGSPADMKRSEEHGFDHHLVKPVDPDLLARVIHQTVAS